MNQQPSFHIGKRIFLKNRHSMVTALYTNVFSKEKGILVPVIKRAKGPYLYDFDQNRYVDFSLSNASILLGHTSPGITKVIKGWLTKGYGRGYYTSSYGSLTSQLELLLTLKEEKNYHYLWGFYNSGEEALVKLVKIFQTLYPEGMGEFIECYESMTHVSFTISGKKNFTLNFSNISSVPINKLKHLSWILIAVRGKQSTEDIESFLVQASDKGILLASDERDFSSYCFMQNNSHVRSLMKARIFGNWLASGFEFGAILIKDGFNFFAGIQGNNKEPFFAISQRFFGLPPLYRIKTIIAHTKLLLKKGGISELIAKQKHFFSLLKSQQFTMKDNLIYFSDDSPAVLNYQNAWYSLILKGYYFPPSPGQPIFVSFAHDDKILEKASREVVSIIEKSHR